MNKFAAVLAVLVLMAVSAIPVLAAKPTIDTLPEVVRCDTANQQARVYRSDEPFCLKDVYQIAVPIHEGRGGGDWFFQLEIYTTSFESTEICDNDGYLGESYWGAYRSAGDTPYFMLTEYLTENCVPGTYILEIRWENRVDGEVTYYETFFRKWVIPEEGK